MTPFVRRHERPLERQEIARHENLEKERIGHPVDGDTSEVPVDDRCLGSSRNHGLRTAGVGERPLESRGQWLIDGSSGGHAGVMGTAVQIVQPARGDKCGVLYRGRGHPRRIQPEDLREPDAPVIQTPRAKEDQVQRRNPHDRAPEDDDPRAKAPLHSPEIARRQDYPRQRDRENEDVEQGKRREVRQRREQRL